jgi:UDP-N-acetylglucosamine--N-acetylmuramyl-(pentapeptide) pyrophosphoryl-undecaprenol N-acetylglucosamine transferase
MKVLLVGGGSGGHVTPIKAIVLELMKGRHKPEMMMLCDHSFAEQSKTLLRELPVQIETVHSGKFRRYNSLTPWQQLWRLDTLKNLTDVGLIFVGIIESLWLMVRWRPDVMFTKGGFVCVPAALAGFVLRVPIVMHDSDAHPGLANRIISRWAARILTGAPLEFYHYPAAKTRYVGTPIDMRFTERYDEAQAKKDLGLDPKRPLIVVTGGGLGSVTINEAVAELGEEWLRSGWQVYHIAGQGNDTSLKARFSSFDDYRIVAFEAQMLRVLQAADVVVARAGATTLLELAALKKPTIIIPNPYLTSGHQLKNAAVYDKADAAIVISEDMVADELADAVSLLVTDTSHAADISEKMHSLVRLDAAKEAADEIKRVGLGGVSKEI